MSTTLTASAGDAAYQAPDAIDFIGARFDLVTLEQAAELCAGVGGAPFRWVVTPNVDQIVRLNRESEKYQTVWDAAWLSVCDSRILQLLAKFSKIDMPVVPGSDLTQYLFEHYITPDTRVNVIGGDDDVIAKVKARYGLKNITVHSPPMGLRTNPAAIAACAEFAAANPAAYTFICVGSPQGEMVSKAIADRGGATGAGLSVGASLDFLAGRQVRAPRWMQNARLEWLYRLLQNPKRMYKRYLIDGPKIFKLYLNWRRAKTV